MSTPRRYLHVAVAVVVVLFFETASAIRFDWSQAELDCALSLGIDLTADPDPGSYNYVKRLAWLADLIVTGTVAEIRHDIRGAYHTHVQINVLSVKKGQPPEGPLTIALISGPGYVPSEDKIMEAVSSSEPSFVKGESVLVFLTKGHIEASTPSGPSYDFPENFYSVVNESKFKITGSTATLSGWGSGSYNLANCGLQINQVVLAQSTNCQDGPQE